MELVANVNSSEINTNEEDDEVIMPPGFRFHPTDEELVGFYLQRKVEKKLMRIEFIKQIDIYKYDPWDLPKEGCVGEKEWYFFCIRGRKYRNSIRPNRVTGSGFWKATGIDKAIYGVTEPHHCIGLKKSLVYYRGSAGKGTKTDWMMHEFRLPPNSTIHNLQQAEVWTLCRIFKRIPSHKKYTPTLKDTESSSAANKPSSPTHHSTSKTFSSEQSENQRKQILTEQVVEYERNQLFLAQAPPTMSYPCFNGNPTIVEDVFANGSWDELGPMVQFAVDPSRVYDCT